MTQVFEKLPEFIQKIVEKLKQVFELINNDKDYKGALVVINGIIAKNKDIYIKIS